MPHLTRPLLTEKLRCRRIQVWCKPGWVKTLAMPQLTTDRPFFFSLSDLSYVGFVPVGDLLDIKGDKKTFHFCCKNKSQNIDLFLS